ncbi:MAG: YfiR family protein [Pseudomonadota bacterium]
MKPTMIHVRKIARVSLLVLAGVFASSQSLAALFSADAVKAAFLYRFASYIEWPEDAPAAGPFVIAVYGAEDVAKQLDELLPKMTVHGRPALVRRVTRASELEGVHILYVGPKEPLARSRSLREAAILLPILIVTDDVRGLDAGGVINFIEASPKVRFEVSLAAADRARLKIASALLSVAARVERRPQAWSNCADPHVRRHRQSACVIRFAMAERRVQL